MEASNLCFSCQQTLWVSFFFDEPAHDAIAEQGTNNLSSLGKIFHSHAEEYGKGIYRIYYNGLGVKFREPNLTRRKTAVEMQQTETIETAKDKGWEAAGDVALKGVKVREVAKDLVNPKSWFTEIPGILGKALVESLDAVRDLPLVSRVMLSGANTRVDNAVAKLAQIVEQQEDKVVHINVAVFGAGLGGALARSFVNRLLEKCEQRASLLYPTPWGTATLTIRFLGLLDCMSATLDDNPVNDAVIDGMSMGQAILRVDGPMGIPPQVEEVSHYVAGHELRVSRRVDSVRRGQAQYSREAVLPGNHDDLVGNYPNDVNGRSPLLSRVAVQALHGDAFAAGVPVMSMDKLENVDFKLFMLMANSGAVRVHDGMPNLPLSRLLLKYPMPSGSLEAQFLAHTRNLISWMRLRYDTPDHPSRPPARAYELVFQQIERIDRMLSHPHATFRLSEQDRTLLETWSNPLPLNDYVLALFDHFVHDELPCSALDEAAADWGLNGYFKIRGVDESDEIS
jgi:hypothetical protein